MSKITVDDDKDWVDKLTDTVALNKERPRQNTIFLVFMGVAGVALVISMSIMSWQSLEARDACECNVPGITLSSGTYIPPDQDKCMTDQSYVDCYNQKTNDWEVYAGMAGLGGGLILLSLLGLRYV